jgi:hypothetical protein
VDDIVLTASSAGFLKNVIGALQREFAMTDMGQLHHFLGISVTRSIDSLFLSQRQYTQDILERVGMSACKPCSTPLMFTPNYLLMDLPLMMLPSTAAWQVLYST